MPKPKFDVVLFDIDNVLVDTRESYLAAIQKTVEIYLNHPGIISLKEVDQFKLLGGFNDDWDCCYGIIAFLETSIQGKPVRFGDHRRHRLSIAELGELFHERPLGVEGLMKHLRSLYERVEMPSFKKIARIFQEVYLGRKLFLGVGARSPRPIRKGGGTPPLQYWNRPGLIEKEKLIFPKFLLRKIHKKGIRFGIVTGRNRFEAQYALKRFGILKLFDCLITIDEVRLAEKRTGKILRKPNPWPLLEAARRIQCRGAVAAPKSKGRGNPAPTFLYVGDLPDDVLAAKRARKSMRISAVAFPSFARDPEGTMQELRKAKPDYLIKKPNELLKIL